MPTFFCISKPFDPPLAILGSGRTLSRRFPRSLLRMWSGTAIRLFQSSDARLAHSLGIAKQEVYVRRALRPDEDLIGEEGLTQANEGEVRGDGRTAHEPLAQNSRERRRYAANLLDAESSVAEEVSQRAKSK